MMTATIAPSAAMPNSVRNDPALRLADYAAALRHYLSVDAGRPDGILFCENSGHDLAQIRDIAARENPHGKPVDTFSMVSATPPARGKGYSEFDLLDRAFEAHVAHWPATTRVWKLTGRLIVRNIVEVIAAAPDCALYADFRQVPLIGERLGGNDWVDTRLFAFTPEGYRRHLLDLKREAGTTIEKHVFRTLRPRLDDDPGIVPRFRVQPRLRGRVGGNNRDYEGLGYRAKDGLRAFARRYLPGLWI